jgi:hypothetical protein
MGAAGVAGQPGPAGPAGWFDTGCPGPVISGVCLLEHENRQATTFLAAAARCAALGGDLCTDSQGWALTQAATPVLTGPHWLSGFSDNDQALWSGANGGTPDNPVASAGLGYACCGGYTPSNPHVVGQVRGGVWVTAVHNVADTTFAGAVAYCTALRSDICTDSQTFLLRKAGALSVPSWTAFHADNDAGGYTAINGGTADDPTPTSTYAFACCGSNRPTTLTCPVATTGGVCAVAIHNVADSTFDQAATACAGLSADLCSIAQSAVLRSGGALSVPVWTSSHSDNDNNDAAVGVGAMPDNPVLTSAYGYACCVN